VKDLFDTYIEAYKSGPLSAYVEDQRLLGTAGQMIECRQPAGDMSDPPVAQYVIVELFTSGVYANYDLGSGKRREMVAKNNLYLIPAFIATDIQLDDAHLLRCFAVDHSIVTAALEDNGFANLDGDFNHLHSGHFRSKTITALMQALWLTTANQDASDLLFAETASMRIVIELARLASQPKLIPSGGLSPWQVRRVTEAIKDRIDHNFSLAELAEISGLSMYHFCRAFKQSVGVAPHEYQIGQRIEQTRVMLTTTNKPVTQIAFAVGYESSQALARAFRSIMGTSPSDYRRTALR
jgi:AraC family transcriptional regulator